MIDLRREPHGPHPKLRPHAPCELAAAPGDEGLVNRLPSKRVTSQPSGVTRHLRGVIQEVREVGGSVLLPTCCESAAWHMRSARV